jgi:hypothetical protein
LAERSDGKFDLDIGPEHSVLVRPHGKDIDPEEIKVLRLLLERAGTTPTDGTADNKMPAPATGSHFALAIDHHSARLFDLFSSGGEPAKPLIITPKDPHGFLRHMEHRKEADYAGQHAPEDHDYYDRIATLLDPSSKIILLCHGHGKSNAGEYFVAYLKEHHPGLAPGLLAVVSTDLSHMTDGEIVAEGRAHLPVGAGSAA